MVRIFCERCARLRSESGRKRAEGTRSVGPDGGAKETRSGDRTIWAGEWSIRALGCIRRPNVWARQDRVKARSQAREDSEARTSNGSA